ncbi:hypothetical protein [Nocardioides sp.]|uniref:hypothetical protein n=1 Tax=Nocardioides sp. TaxID=35761 RepID=UPI002D00CB3A|nr:hypothetical protein [Nocardioides sp.]HSX66388.1 hypothetical protein [Nocardioides sp.]
MTEPIDVFAVDAATFEIVRAMAGGEVPIADTAGALEDLAATGAGHHALVCLAGHAATFLQQLAKERGSSIESVAAEYAELNRFSHIVAGLEGEEEEEEEEEGS